MKVVLFVIIDFRNDVDRLNDVMLILFDRFSDLIVVIDGLLVVEVFSVMMVLMFLFEFRVVWIFDLILVGLLVVGRMVMLLLKLLVKFW